MGVESRIEQSQAGGGNGSSVAALLSAEAQDHMKDVANQKKPLPDKGEKGPETDPEMIALKEQMKFEKKPQPVPDWFKEASGKDGLMSRAELEKAIDKLPQYKCPTEESTNLHRMRDNFATIAGDDNLISFPELYAYNKQNPSRFVGGCGGE